MLILSNLYQLITEIAKSDNLSHLEKAYANNFITGLICINQLAQNDEIVTEDNLNQFISDETKLSDNYFWLNFLNQLHLDIVKINGDDATYFLFNNQLISFKDFNSLIEPIEFNEDYFIKHVSK